MVKIVKRFPLFLHTFMFEAMVIIVFVKDERISWGDCLSFLKNIKFKGIC
jgi:hypothetical protein